MNYHFLNYKALGNMAYSYLGDWITARHAEAKSAPICRSPPPGIARARELGIRVHGHFDGQPGLPDAQAARRAIAYVLRRFNGAAAIVLIRDMDDQPERRGGFLPRLREAVGRRDGGTSTPQCRTSSFGSKPVKRRQTEQIEKRTQSERAADIGIDDNFAMR